MKRIVKVIERLLKLLLTSVQNKFFDIVLKNIPIRLLKLIPCSYSNYLKCFQPRRGNVVIDCGAHIGNNSIIFSRLVKKEGLIIALEPLEEPFMILNKRMKRLRIDNVVAINKGVWKSDVAIPLQVFSDTTLTANVCNVNKGILKDELKVDCITLDTLVKEMKLHRVDLIKMDIEGAEIEALKGSEKIMETLLPYFAIASYHVRDGKKTYIEVEKMLINKGYSVRSFSPPHLTTCGYPPSNHQ